MSVAFLLTSLLVVATPGTGVLLTIAAGLARGPRAGVVTAFGCTLGIVPHLAAAVTGAAALLHAGGVLFEVVKVLGIAYLLFMAWSTWRDGGSFAPATDAPARSNARIIVAAVLANLLNPKLTLFFFAFLPQFVPATDPHAVSKLLALSGVFMAMRSWCSPRTGSAPAASGATCSPGRGSSPGCAGRSPPPSSASAPGSR